MSTRGRGRGRSDQRHERRHIAGDRDGWVCCMCGVELECHQCNPQSTKVAATLEHIVPIAGGGTNLRANLAVSCYPCNSEKGTNAPPLTQHIALPAHLAALLEVSS